MPGISTVPVVPEPTVLHVRPDVSVTVFVAGWVAVRPAHRRFRGPDALALPAIVLGRGWTEWMPIHAFLIRHPEGLVMVDTGEAESRPPGWFGCGSDRTETFYRRFLRMSVPPEAALPRTLAEASVDPREVDTVVVTHLHSDHTGNIAAFDHARVLVGEGGAEPYPGSTHCRLPGAGRTEQVRWTDGAVGPFARSAALTSDGVVLSVPLPGHTPGHQGVMILGEDRTVVIAGDAAFGVEQVRSSRAPGIAADRRANRRTQAELASFLDGGGTVLFSHVPVE